METIINTSGSVGDNRPPTKTNTEIELKKMELEMLKKFLSSDRQKTQITADERVLIGVIDGFAKKPYPISQAICEKLGIPFKNESFKMDFIQEFLACFIEYGIPLDRAGRGEEVKVLTGYFRAQEMENSDNKEKVTSKLMK